MVDICKPPLVWLEGKCYRVNTEVEYTVTAGYTGEEETNMVIEDNLTGEIEDSFNHQIEELGNSRYRVMMQVAAAFFPQIIGKGGQTKNRLESDTRTKIVIPRKGLEGDIMITGGDRRGVAVAANRIDVMVAAARNKQPFTHFISIPVNMDHVQKAFLRFKEEVLKSCSSDLRGLDETIFQTETLLHLTVGTMALLDQRERDLARELLMDCKEQILMPVLGDDGLEFELTGLEFMNDDPGEVDVLYAGVLDKTGILQKVVEGIVDKFVASGLMRREYDTVKLHLTLINTLFRRDQGDVGDKNTGQVRESFDCRPVVEGWGNLSLGQVQLETIHLSQRRAGRRTAEGYYLPSAVVVVGGCG